MHAYSVRSSVPADSPAIVDIYSHYVVESTATFETTPPTVEEIEHRRESILSLGLPHLVATQNGTVVGYAYANIYRPRPAYRFTIEDSIYVAPASVGKGCGRLLLSALVSHCQIGPWQQMVAVIGDSANHPSIKLHRAFGFRHVGTLESVGYKLGRWIDTVLMQRSLA
jgi:L-amino acid N-acyltransferase YncA